MTDYVTANSHRAVEAVRKLGTRAIWAYETNTYCGRAVGAHALNLWLYFYILFVFAICVF